MRYCRTKQSQFSIAQDGVPRCWEWLIFVAAAVVFFFFFNKAAKLVLGRRFGVKRQPNIIV